MRNTSGNIGTFLGASNNLALTTGAGSSWTNLGELRVGYSGSGNQLIVSNAGLVSAQGVVIGRDTGSTNNRAVVDGGTMLARTCCRSPAFVAAKKFTRPLRSQSVTGFRTRHAVQATKRTGDNMPHQYCRNKNPVGFPSSAALYRME